ncbi:hypothetical protein Pmani_020641 [Petrolisthes manimaculis]|uniref:Uncharacterized protein n=1 Tax=Petrolisthes manimaculis TaxID=1843537 RepID=A0AAE1PGC5_9EUCA|nr:hypothetical protein Pmani_020641 [Petrolisthes manimaculis]
MKLNEAGTPPAVSKYSLHPGLEFRKVECYEGLGYFQVDCGWLSLAEPLMITLHLHMEPDTPQRSALVEVLCLVVVMWGEVLL